MEREDRSKRGNEQESRGVKYPKFTSSSGSSGESDHRSFSLPSNYRGGLMAAADLGGFGEGGPSAVPRSRALMDAQMTMLKNANPNHKLAIKAADDRLKNIPIPSETDSAEIDHGFVRTPRVITIDPPEKPRTMSELSPGNVFWREATGKIIIHHDGDDATLFTIVGVVKEDLVPGPHSWDGDDEGNVCTEKDNVLLMKLGRVDDIEKKLNGMNTTTKCMFQGRTTQRINIKGLPVLSDEFKMEELTVLQAVDGVTEENVEMVKNYLYGEM